MKSFRPLTAGTLALVLASAAAADTTNMRSTDGSAAITISNPITLAKVQGLDFGAVTSGSAGGVAIDPDSGARSVDGGVGAVSANAGKPGVFAITGLPNAVINISVGSEITGFGAGITGVTKVSTLPTVLRDSSASFAVGGYLNIPPLTKPGEYFGTYKVSVNYP
jgi:hypothetical protein